MRISTPRHSGVTLALSAGGRPFNIGGQSLEFFDDVGKSSLIVEVLKAGAQAVAIGEHRLLDAMG